MVQFLDTGFYVNPRSLIAIGVIFPVLGFLAVLARFVARVRWSQGVKVDDWLCLPALACVVGTGALFIYGATSHDIGYRMPPGVSLAELLADPSYNKEPMLKIEYASNILCCFSAGMIRLSFLFFYRRLFRGRWFDIVSWTAIGMMILWLIAVTIAYFTICGDHISAIWSNRLQECPRYLGYGGGVAITGFVLDLCILIIPFPWIWRLQMPTAQKWAVSSVFLCGLFTVSASGTRFAVGIDAIRYKRGRDINIMGLRNLDDIVGYTSVWLFWLYTETGTGMIVCCLPSLKSYFNTLSAQQLSQNIQSFVTMKSRGHSRRRRTSSETGLGETGSISEAGQEKSALGTVITSSMDHQRRASDST